VRAAGHGRVTMRAAAYVGAFLHFAIGAAVLFLRSSDAAMALVSAVLFVLGFAILLTAPREEE